MELTEYSVVSPFGILTAALRGTTVLRISAESAETHLPPIPEDHEVNRAFQRWFRGECREAEWITELQGTEFQMRVWRELQRIPYGETRTYGDIAAKIGSPKAFRAVGAACGANPVLIAVPCHRVVSQAGMGGFSAGIELKKRLLAFESQQILPMPALI